MVQSLFGLVLQKKKKKKILIWIIIFCTYAHSWAKLMKEVNFSRSKFKNTHFTPYSSLPRLKKNL